MASFAHFSQQRPAAATQEAPTAEQIAAVSQHFLQVLLAYLVSKGNYQSVLAQVPHLSEKLERWSQENVLEWTLKLRSQLQTWSQEQKSALSGGKKSAASPSSASPGESL